MKRQAGFTLVELMVVIAILGILAMTAIPLVGTYRQRAYGSQATALAKQLVDGEIMYYLEHNKFVPETDQTITILRDAVPPNADVDDIYNKLNVQLPLNGVFIYGFSNIADERLVITIQAPFSLYKNGNQHVMIELSKDGKADYY